MKCTRTIFNKLSDPKNLGTLNPESFALPAFHKKRQLSPFDEIAELSKIADELKEQNEELKARLQAQVNQDELNAFQQFQKYQMDINSRMAERESEIDDLASFFNSFRTSRDPTFVEVNASNVRKTKYDTITASLLVSNDQRSFFTTNDLQKLNNELKSLIVAQRESLKSLNGRLKVFEEFQSEVYIKKAIESLKNGNRPAFLTGETPTLKRELEAKQRVLSNELQKLVNIRKEALKPERLEKRRLRNGRRMNAAATKIQRVFRGYVDRKAVKQMREAGLKITNVARGYLARMEYYRILDEMERENRPHVVIEMEEQASGEHEYEYEYEEVSDDDLPEIIQYGVPSPPDE